MMIGKSFQFACLLVGTLASTCSAQYLKLGFTKSELLTADRQLVSFDLPHIRGERTEAIVECARSCGVYAVRDPAGKIIFPPERVDGVTTFIRSQDFGEHPPEYMRAPFLPPLVLFRPDGTVLRCNLGPELKSGVYRIELDTSAAAWAESGTLGFESRLSVQYPDSPILANADITYTIPVVGREVEVSIQVTENDRPVTGSSVRRVVANWILSREDPATTEGAADASDLSSLMDDGLRPDEIAADGRFTASWTPSVPGSYVMLLRFDGLRKAPEGFMVPFSIEGSDSIDVRSAAAKLVRPVLPSFEFVDTSTPADGVEDALRAGAAVEFDSPGEYTVEFLIENSDGSKRKRFPVQVTIDAQATFPAEELVEVTIPLADGPFLQSAMSLVQAGNSVLLTDISLSKKNIYGEREKLDDAWELDRDEGQPVRLSITGRTLAGPTLWAWADQVVFDCTDDPSYPGTYWDAVGATFPVMMQGGGRVAVSADLVNICTDRVVSHAKGIFDIAQGLPPTNVRIVFDGRDLGRQGFDGPFALTNIQIFGTGLAGAFSPGGRVLTPAWPASAFDDFPNRELARYRAHDPNGALPPWLQRLDPTRPTPGGDPRLTICNSFWGCKVVDRNHNGIHDQCDIWSGTSRDQNGNGIPDEVDPDFCLADLVGANGEPPGDGIVDGSDFVAFINAFAMGDLLADVAGGSGEGGPDGVIDGGDFIAFINAFSLGCQLAPIDPVTGRPRLPD